MIELSDVNVMLDDKSILRSIDFVWRKGETVALLGPNGAGKSTLLKVVATLIKPTSGRLTFPEGMNKSEWRQTIGAVFQETFLYGSLTALENLEFYAKLYRCYDQKWIEEMLHRVGLWKVRNEKVNSYSKGMRQRLSLARALIHRPECLLFDEPFDGLDVESSIAMEQLFMQLRKEGVGWILVSHDIRQAWDYCDRAVLLYNGRINKESACHENTYESFLLELRHIMKESYGHAIP